MYNHIKGVNYYKMDYHIEKTIDYLTDTIVDVEKLIWQLNYGISLYSQ